MEDKRVMKREKQIEETNLINSVARFVEMKMREEAQIAVTNK